MFLRKLQCTTFVVALTMASAGYSFAADTRSVTAGVLKDVSDKSVDEAFQELDAVLRQQNEQETSSGTLNASNATSGPPSATNSKPEISRDSGYYKSDDAFFAGVKKPERVFKNID